VDNFLTSGYLPGSGKVRPIPGFVYFVGAGPGDPELLTIKALRLMQIADVVLYDRLISKEILKLIPSGVTRLYVGKESGNHCVCQSDINDLLIGMALKGRTVVRLKGGDPFIFGRGSEEALVLRRAGIPFEIVPGITAAAGCSAYAGIPLTHRGLSHGVRFVTGHFKDGKALDFNWDKLADPDCTLVIYMGLSNLSLICNSLIKAGLAKDTPAAAIENGSTHNQCQLISSLSALADAVAGANLHAPVIIVIGRVVSLSDELNWFDVAQGQLRHDSWAAHAF